MFSVNNSFLLFLSFLFTMAVFIFETLRFEIGYINFFKNLYAEFGVLRTLVGILAVSVSVIWVYWFVSVSLASTVIWRIFYFVFFSFALSVEYTSMKGYGRFTVTTDWVSAFYADRKMRADSFENYFNRDVLPVLFSFGMLLLLTNSSSKNGVWLFLITFSAAALINLILAKFVKEGTFPTLSLSAFMRTFYLLPTLRTTLKPRQIIEFPCTIPATQNIILIVDESVRADHLSLNSYIRPTTRYLEQLQQEGLLFNFTNAQASANSSLPSNAIILTGSRRSDKAGYNSLPSIFQYAKNMRYKTFFLDGWGPNFWIGKISDLKFIDYWQNISDFRDVSIYDVDFVIAGRIREILVNSTGNLVWVNKRGVHFNYNNNYPADKAEWNPVWQSYDRLDKIEPLSRERLINSYDNALLYNLDPFFKVLLNDVNLEKTTIIYTSDHGQTLGEDGLTSTHARQSAGVMDIPLFILSKKNISLRKNFTPTHENIFPTILELMQVSKDFWATDYLDSLVEHSVSPSDI
jgi:glucan phosphoethanolaminetransferase (alkaline phosphatase superfamily)